MVELEITPAEKTSGEMRKTHLEAAVHALKTDGIVVLKDAVNLAHIEILRARMLEDVSAILARDDCPYNFNTCNIQQDPPPFHPYLFKDILLNELVIDVTYALLGPGLRNSFYSGNTALPSDLRQPVHPDHGQLWPGLETVSPAFAFVVNVPMVDVTPENGATEFWPGSHLDTTVSVFQRDFGSMDSRIPESALEKRREIAPPFQASLSAGSVVIRDMRLWHAGMPNHTDRPRPMIAMVHYIKWRRHDPIVFEKGTESFFEHPRLRTNAVFVEGPVDYLHHHKRAKPATMK